MSGQFEWILQVSSTQDQWTVGETMAFTFGKDMYKKIGFSFSKHSLTFSETVKFTQAYLNLNSSSRDNSITLDYPYQLFEPGQDSGIFIYAGPQIKRYRYNTYPWWETNALQYPLPHSTQYLFRTYGLSTVNKSIPLSKNPFFVPDPNGSTMHDWMDTVRYGLQNYNIGHDKSPGITLNWDNNNPGGFGHISTTIDTTTSHGESRDYYIEGSITYQVKTPKIFQKFTGSVIGVLNGKYTTETSVRTEFGDAVTLSLSNLYAQSDGVNISSLHENVYLFTWEQDSTLWIYDSLDGRHPCGTLHTWLPMLQ